MVLVGVYLHNFSCVYGNSESYTVSLDRVVSDIVNCSESTGVTSPGSLHTET